VSVFQKRKTGISSEEAFMNPIAEELNDTIAHANRNVLDMLSAVGRNLFFPKGILTQSAEAREKAHHINATVGIATETGSIMHLPSIMEQIRSLPPEKSITYAPSYGLPELRSVWQTSLFDKNPSLSGKTVSLPVVTGGITHGVSVFADLWVDPGDVVILPAMMWGNYNMIFSVRKGARIRQYPIFTEDMKYNVEAFAAAVQSEAADCDKIIVVLNFPHNPSGYSISRKETDALVDILTDVAESGTNVVAAMDDSYFGLYYDAETFNESLFAPLSGRHPRLLGVKLDGATKEHFVWGLRIGFITYGAFFETNTHAAYAALEKKTAGCVRGTVSNASHLSQSLLLKSMRGREYIKEKAQKFEILKRRALCVKQVLSDPKFDAFWQAYPFNSGYFMCLRLKTVPAEELRVHLLDRYGVGLIAVGEKDLRVAFSCVDENRIPELFDIIYRGILDLS
jgi:aspartate/methionine/tyrosine aminotransferase